MGRRRQASHIYERPDSPVYWCWYYDTAGKLHRRSTRATTRPGAEAALADLERRARDPAYAASHKATLDRAVDELLTHRRDVKRSAAGTVSMYRIKGGHLVRILGAATPLGAIGARDVDGFISKRTAEGAASTTISKELTTLRAALKLARRRGEYARDPAEVIPAFAAEYKPRRRFLSPSELERVLAQLEPDRSARVAFIVATGARWGESDRAQRGDADKKGVRLRGTKTATSARIVPLLPDDLVPMRVLLAHAAKHGAGEARWFTRWGNVRRDLAAACARAGVATCTPNDLRRTIATWLRARGVAPSLIGPFLGHTDGRMVERVYGRLPPEELAAAISRQAGVSQRESTVRESGRRAGKVAKMGSEKSEKRRRKPVPRVGIEPTTRGFSVPAPKVKRGRERRALRLVA